LPHLYFAGNLVADKLYFNKGKLKFEDATASSGLRDDQLLGWSTGVSMVDVNADGYLDIYVCRGSKGLANRRY
jgi:hypothetical protein